jgi:lipopolysaccharide/colanic/teichoic acid biosynthesis glycosyltransferase
MLKRAFDFLSSLFGLILILPVLVTLSILIKREDGDPFFIEAFGLGDLEKPLGSLNLERWS